jgi:hypothetical protein
MFSVDSSMESCVVSFKALDETYVNLAQEAERIALALQEEKTDVVFTKVVLSRSFVVIKREGVVSQDHNMQCFDGVFSAEQFLKIVQYDKAASNEAWRERMQETFATFN